VQQQIREEASLGAWRRTVYQISNDGTALAVNPGDETGARLQMPPNLGSGSLKCGASLDVCARNSHQFERRPSRLALELARNAPCMNIVDGSIAKHDRDQLGDGEPLEKGPVVLKAIDCHAQGDGELVREFVAGKSRFEISV
jgi:hypothetical protein